MAQLSNCCQAPIKATHGCDDDLLHGGKKCTCEIVTSWYVCSACSQACDVYVPYESVRRLPESYSENSITPNKSVEPPADKLREEFKMCSNPHPTMNKEELRKRFDKAVLAQDGLIHKAEEAWEDYCRNPNGFVPKFWCSRFFPSNEILSFIQSEIEAAEKAKVEEVIEEIDKRLAFIDDPWGDPHIQDWIRSKFL